MAYAAKRDKEGGVVAEGVEGPGFQEIGSPVFSPDGLRLVYAAKSEKHWGMVDGPGSGPKFMEISPPYFSPDGKRLAYCAKRRAKKGPSQSDHYSISHLSIS